MPHRDWGRANTGSRQPNLVVTRATCGGRADAERLEAGELPEDALPLLLVARGVRVSKHAKYDKTYEQDLMSRIRSNR